MRYEHDYFAEGDEHGEHGDGDVEIRDAVCKIWVSGWMEACGCECGGGRGTIDSMVTAF